MKLDPDSLAIEDRAFVDRACRYLDGTMEESEFQGFQDELRGNRDRQELLVQLSAQEVLLVQCGEGMVEESNRRQFWQVDRQRLRLATVAAIAAALILSFASIFLNVEDKTASMRLQQVAAAKFADSELTETEFSSIRLNQGVAGFSLESGVSLIASDRCRATMIGSGTIKLEFGTLVIDVPDSADGIRIETPHAAFRDVGTRFVLSVTPQHTELHVLDGQVAVLDHNQQDLNHALTLVDGREALRIQDLNDSGGIVRTQFDPAKYALEVPTEIQIPVTNTGLKHRVGDSDGYWAVIELPTDIGMDMQRAAVVTLNSYEPNNAERSQWISVEHPLPEKPGNAKYQFRTGFELTGTKPETARLEGRFWVDNYVTAIRINGVEQRVPDQRSSGLNHPPGAATEFAVTTGFRNGFNLLEFDVINRFSEGNPNRFNPLAFRCELAGSVKVDLDPAAAAAADPENQPLPQQP
jgi:ferric-dicitrate binding protein FerR (iron transport regulator)